MATRSFITQKANDTYQGVYCHWDGYPEFTGAMLVEHYSDRRKLASLLALGDISVLGPSIGRRHSFDKRGHTDETTFYGRDRGETGLVARPKTFHSRDGVRHYAEKCGAEFLYLYENGEWLFAERGAQYLGMSDGTPFSQFRPLSKRLSDTE